MADEKKNERNNENESVDKPKRKYMRLRTIDDHREVYEWLLNRQINGEIDAKAVDGLNTTMKGAVYLNAKLKMDLVKLMVQAQIKKIEIPEGLLPE